jgi:hypothetical protein
MGRQYVPAFGFLGHARPAHAGGNMKLHVVAACFAVALLAGCATGGSEKQTAVNERAAEVLRRLDPSADGKPVRLRAVHMGGNWSTNRWGDGTTPLGAIDTLPEEYFTYLEGLNVNWVGIMVAIHVTDSMDADVKRIYESEDKAQPSSNDVTPSFTDDQLVNAIRALKRHGFNVYLTLAYEPKHLNVDHPVDRGSLGDPSATQDRPQIDPKFWPWSLGYPGHDAFVERFWSSYTDQAVSIGRLAEEEGVALYSLGTETDGLFRSRSGGYHWLNEYKEELRAMVASVREVYSGLLTYDMLAPIITAPNEFYVGSYYLFHDIGLDVIGVSAYFQLYDRVPPEKVPSVPSLEKKWQTIFDRYLSPLKARNDGLPILFLECGYTDSINAVVNPSADELQKFILIDQTNNGLDDGEETQANIYQAFFNVMEKNPTVVNGAFLWGIMMADDAMFQNGWNTGATVRDLGFRQNLAEEVVRDTYSRWRD